MEEVTVQRLGKLSGVFVGMILSVLNGRVTVKDRCAIRRMGQSDPLGYLRNTSAVSLGSSQTLFLLLSFQIPKTCALLRQCRN